jgi:signal recognition particle subunit SRP68
MGEFEFDGNTVSIESEVVRVAVLNVQEAATALDKVSGYEETMEAYDQLFIAYNDMMQLVAQQIRSIKNDEQVGEMKQLEQYVEAKKLGFTMERNEAMAAKLEADLALHQVKPDELLRVYNILAQNAEQLAGYYDDQGGESVKLLVAKGFYFKAHRCSHLAGKFCADKQFPEAVALYDRADGMVQMAISQFEDCSSECFKYVESAQKLQLRIRGVKCAVQAEAFLQEHTADTAAKPAANKESSLSLLDRLDDWVELEAGIPAQLVEFPPTVQSIACKPIMYDLALNHVKFPDLSARATQKKQGIMGKAKGLLSSFWG